MNIVSAMLLICLVLAGGYGQHLARIRSQPFAIASAGLLLLLITGMLWTTGPPNEAMRIVEKHARILCAVFAVMLLLDEKWQRRALMAWFASMLLTLGLSYLHSLWAFPLARATRDGLVGDHVIFKHHITQNVMMSVFVIAAACEVIRSRQQGDLRRALWWTALTAGSVINIIFFVAGRTGHLTLAINLLVVCVALLRGRQRLLVGAVAVGVLALMASASDRIRMGIDTAVSEVESRDATGIDTSIGQRLGYAQTSIELIKARPFLGWGTGSYATEFCRIAETAEWCVRGSYNPHNQFLFFGVQLGALGILAYVAWLLTAAWALRKQPPLTRALGFCVLATLVVHSMLDSPLYIVTEGAWYPLMLGILTATTDSSKVSSAP